MKKHFLLLAGLLAATMMSADVMLIDHTQFFRADAVNTNGTTLERENYTSTSGDIKANQWNGSGKSGMHVGESSTVSASTLEYTEVAGKAYIDNKKGLMIESGWPAAFTSGTGHDDIFSLVNDQTYTEKAYYAAFLLRVDSCKSTDGNDIFAFDGNAFANGQRGRVFVKKGTASKTFRLGMAYNQPNDTKGTTPTVTTCPDIAFGTTVLVVAKITPNKSDGAQETFALYVNPLLDSQESANTPVDQGGVEGATTYMKAIKGLTVRQRNNIAYHLAGLRFTDSWAEAVKAAAPAENPDYANSLYADFSNDSTKWTSLDNAPTSSEFPTDTLNDYILTATAIVKSGKTLYFDDNNLKYVKFTTRAHMDKINFNGSIETPWLASIETLYLYTNSGSDDRNFTIQTRVANGQWEDLATIPNKKTTQIFAIPVNKSNIKLRIVNTTTSAQYFYYIGDMHPEVYAQLRESMKKEKGETAFGEGNTYTTSTAVGKHGTICLPYNCSVSGATIYAYQEQTGEGLVFEVAEQQVVEAGKAYIYFATEATQTWTKIDDPENTAKDVDITGNFIGTYADYDLKNNEYFLYTAGTQDEFRPAGENVYVPAFRAFVSKTLLNYVEGENAAVRVVFPTHNPIVTGVEEASAAKATKALVNGKLVIVRGAHTFNANGAMLK